MANKCVPIFLVFITTTNFEDFKFTRDVRNLPSLGHFPVLVVKLPIKESL